jgi:hypothetical protein
MKTRHIFLLIYAILIPASIVSGQENHARRANPTAGLTMEKAPLISTRWGQGCIFNAGCPGDTASHTTCLHVPAGSGAIAMAQIMKFYIFPAH